MTVLVRGRLWSGCDGVHGDLSGVLGVLGPGSLAAGGLTPEAADELRGSR